ncbi:hypothetical protein BDQ12DRAFT_678032 [Crucibulum laeve]|uniref:Uncharacterized protein n=1 Tax=Crucibulum laeve TaxID=68775 RepID=A0A5C3M9A4_9AGAR|nr:hypothetical protein BDQ12DRAFT_678032 [Crucibulum laeve]
MPPILFQPSINMVQVGCLGRLSRSLGHRERGLGQISTTLHNPSSAHRRKYVRSDWISTILHFFDTAKSSDDISITLHSRTLSPLKTRNVIGITVGTITVVILLVLVIFKLGNYSPRIFSSGCLSKLLRRRTSSHSNGHKRHSITDSLELVDKTISRHNSKPGRLQISAPLSNLSKNNHNPFHDTHTMISESSYTPLSPLSTQRNAYTPISVPKPMMHIPNGRQSNESSVSSCATHSTFSLANSTRKQAYSPTSSDRPSERVHFPLTPRSAPATGVGLDRTPSFRIPRKPAPIYQNIQPPHTATRSPSPSSMLLGNHEIGTSSEPEGVSDGGPFHLPQKTTRPSLYVLIPDKPLSG